MFKMYSEEHVASSEALWAQMEKIKT